MFVLLTGYFGIKNRTSISKMISFWLQVLFYTVVGFGVQSLMTGFSLGNLLRAFTPITSKQYWFASVYFLLMLVSPLMNRGLESLSKKQFKVLLFLLLGVFSGLQTIFYWGRGTFSTGYDITWFVTLYSIGAYIRLYGVNISRKMCAVAWLLSWLTTFLVSRVFTPIVTLELLGTITGTGVLYQYTSPTVVVSAVALFLLLEKTRIEDGLASRSICYVGRLCFGVYLFHECPQISQKIWEIMAPGTYIGAGIFRFAAHCFVIVASIFVIGCIIEQIRLLMFQFVGIDKLIRRLQKWEQPILPLLNLERESEEPVIGEGK